MATPIIDVDSFGDDDIDFLAQVKAAEEEAQTVFFKRRRITSSIAAASPATTATPESANVKPLVKLEKEGAYTAALKGRGISVSNATASASSTVAGGGYVGGSNGNGACFKCGKEGHWARDCGAVNAVPGGDGLEKSCPCGIGMCLVLTANTERNRGRKFFRCPLREENGGCAFFEWCDKVSANSNFPEETQGSTGLQLHSYSANQERFGLSRSYSSESNKRAMPSGPYGEPRGYSYSDNSDNINKPRTGFGSGTSSCFKCGKEGHWARDCPISPSSSNNPSMKVMSGTPGGATSFSSGACYKCGEPGHWARDCSSSGGQDNRGQDNRGGYRR